MKDIDATPRVVRYYICITLTATLVWLIYVSITAFVRVPSVLAMFDEFGGTIPVISALLKHTYQYFALIPLLGIILTIDLLRRNNIPTIYAACVFIVLAVLGSLMHFILYEGMFAPLWKLLNVLG